MINNPRFILPLDGAATVSGSNITVTGGTTPDSTIDLLALNGNGGSSVLVSTSTSCTFDVYSINTIFTPDNANYKCSHSNDGDGNNTNLPNTYNNDNIFSFRDEFLLFLGNEQFDLNEGFDEKS